MAVSSSWLRYYGSKFFANTCPYKNHESPSPIRRPFFVYDIIAEKAHVTCYLAKNSLAVKKGAALFKMASVKKVVKSKGRPRNGCDGIGWKKF